MSMVQLEEHPIRVLNSPSSHSSAVCKAVSVKETSSSCSVSEVKNRTEFSSKVSDTSSANTTQFASPKSSRYVDQIRKSAIPKKPGKTQNGLKERGTVGQSIAWRRCHQRNWKRDMNWTQNSHL